MMPMRIAVVEDVEECLEATLAVLEEELDDALVDTATNKNEALRKLKAAADRDEPFAAVIVDLKIPTTSRPRSRKRVCHDVATTAAELFPDAIILIFTAFARDPEARLDELTARLRELTAPERIRIVEKAEEQAPDMLVKHLRQEAGLLRARSVPVETRPYDGTTDEGAIAAELPERARELRRKNRLGQLTPAEDAELAGLHAILDQPTEEELMRLLEDEARDHQRFRGLLDEFEKVVTALRRKADGR